MKLGAIYKSFLFFGLTGLSLCGQSQDFRFGIQTNPGMVWVRPDNNQIAGDGLRFTFDFGFVMDYIFGDEERYAFNTGLNLFVSGAKIKGTSTEIPGNTLESSLTARINYLEIPLTMKLRSNQTGYFTFYGQFGLVPAFAVRSRADYTIETIGQGGIGVVTTSVENVKLENIPAYPHMIEKVRPFNLGLHTEAGMEYDITESTALAVGIYFNTGFLDIFKDNDDERIVSRNLGVRIGVLF